MIYRKVGGMLKGVINRLIIFVMCMGMLVYMHHQITLVIISSTLFILIIMSVGIYIDDKLMIVFTILLYLLISCYLKEATAFIPILIYEISNYIILYVDFKKDFNCRFSNIDNITKGGRLLLIVEIVVIITQIVLVGLRDNIFAAMWMLLMCIISLHLSIYYNNAVRLKKQLITIRDSATELNLSLKEQNKYLIENQDYKIYLATLTERNRIAREIHDNVGHMLSRSLLQTGAVITINKDEKVKPFLIGIKDTLDQAMNSIRSSVHNLHDESVDLKASIENIIVEMKNYKVDFEYDVSIDVDKKVKYSIISIIKEACSNIMKHSNANDVLISIKENPAFYRIDINDNGNTCRKTQQEINNICESDGIGLANIRDRVKALSGNINITTEKGFRIFITIPIDKKEN